MKIINLTEDSKIYTSNAFLVLGEWNAIGDVNTLIDTGCDVQTIERIEDTNTGLGKRKIDQVILTHSHSDHSGLLPKIKSLFKPVVYAFNKNLAGIDYLLKDGDFINIGEEIFEVFHITAHSHDSLCLYNETNEVLFAGDTIFPIEFENHDLAKANADVLARLKTKITKTVYYGHGPKQEFKRGKFQVTKETQSPGIILQ